MLRFTCRDPHYATVEVWRDFEPCIELQIYFYMNICPHS